MLIVEITPAGGLGAGEVIRLPASQVVLRYADGTPVCVAFEHGPDNTCQIIRPGDAPNGSFNRALRQLGVAATVECSRIRMPAPPPGARLIAAPD